MMRETLTRLGFSESSVEGYEDAVRGDHYDLSISTTAEQQALERMLGEEKTIYYGRNMQEEEQKSP